MGIGIGLALPQDAMEFAQETNQALKQALMELPNAPKPLLLSSLLPLLLLVVVEVEVVI